MRISDWSSDVCSADLVTQPGRYGALRLEEGGSRVLSFWEQGPGDAGLINGGFFACEPEILDLIENDPTVLEESPMSSLLAPGDRKSGVKGKSVPVSVDHGGGGKNQKNKHRTKSAAMRT